MVRTMLSRRPARAVLATLAFVSHGSAAAPAEQAGHVCVTHVEVARSGPRGPEAGTAGPTEFLYGNEAWTPLAISRVKGSGDPSASPARRLLWRWGSDGRFHGPEALAGFEPKGTDGRFVYLQQQQDEPQPRAGSVLTTAPATPETVSRLFFLDNGGAPQELLVPAAWGATLRFTLAEARNGFGPVLLTERPDPELPERPLQERWSASGARLTRFEGHRELRYAFPRAGLEIAADDRSLEITDRRTSSRLTVAVPNRDDVTGIESVSLDRFGWLFVENGGADYAIKLERGANGLRTGHVAEFTGRSWLSRFASWLFGADTGVRIDERRFSPQCADQSFALRMTFFCKPFRALRHGRLETVQGLSDATVRWVGDATGARVALVADRSGGLWATDGFTAQRLSGAGSGLAAVQDVPGAGRTFLTAGRQAWELVGSFPRIQLRRVSFSRSDGQAAPYHCCLSSFRSSDTRFMALPGTSEVLAFHSTLGIWLLGGRDARMIWKAGRSAIDLNSVAGAVAWGGVIFLTEERTPYFVKASAGRCRPAGRS